MTGLTERQLRTLNFIRSFVAEKGYSPSYDEIMSGVGMASRGNVHRFVSCLIERGYLRKAFNRPRSLEVVGAADTLLAICERHLPRLREVAPMAAREIEQWKARNNGSL